MIEFKKNNSFLNEEANTFLKSIIKNKSLANGYIFYGAEGLGKKQTALQFIKEIFKQSSQSENIEERITNNNHTDFLIIEPDSLLQTKSSGSFDLKKTIKSGSEIIKIAQIRNIKTFLSQKSINSEKKIVLIIDAHLLNEAASNCLLKTLEEPSNGIFILLTSKLNLLLDTIISRCQIIRFRSFSSKQIQSILREYLDASKLNINTKLKFEDLINSANGSPNQLLKNIEIWSDFSDEIIRKLDSPIKNSIEILEISKSISEKLEIFQQISLVNLIQTIWWRKTKNVGLVKKLENLKYLLRKNIQPRLAWEIAFLKEYLDTSQLNINTILKFEDLINSANGSPNQLLKNFEIWNSFSDEIINKLDSPIKNSMEILEISKSINEKLEIYQQIYLVNLIQTIWWRKTKNIGLVKKLENLKYLLRKNIQPRIAWEITFLKISLENT